MKKRVGDVAIEVMQENNEDSIGYCTYGLLDTIWYKCFDLGILKHPKPSSKTKPHPINRQRSVMAALENDKRFEKKFMRCTNGRAEVLTRLFYLKPYANPKEKTE